MNRTEFEECIKMIRSKDAMNYEDSYLWLQGFINEYFSELTILLQNEQDPFVRAKFVELIGDSMSVKAIPILEKELYSKYKEVRSWAWCSLMSLENSKATKIAKEYQDNHPNEDIYT